MAQHVTRFLPDNGPSPESTPPLEPGDRLTRPEFERRYDAMPHLRKAELIEGVVYIPSPVRFRHHGRPHALLMGWLIHYEAETPGVWTADNSTARLDLDNEPQPDAVLLIDPARGGQARISEDDYIENAPELVAEVASSSVSIDLTTKLHVYRRNGVREYVVWRVLDRAVDWFVLRHGQYERLEPDAEGLLRSETFPGLWLVSLPCSGMMWPVCWQRSSVVSPAWSTTPLSYVCLARCPISSRGAKQAQVARPGEPSQIHTGAVAA